MMRDLALAMAFVAAIGWGGWVLAIVDFSRARKRWMTEIAIEHAKFELIAARQDPTPMIESITRGLAADCTCDVCRQRRQGEKGRN